MIPDDRIIKIPSLETQEMKIRFSLLSLVFAALVLILSGCDSRRNNLEQGVRYAKRAFQRVNTNALDTSAFQSNADMGGSLLTFLTASLPENSDLPPFSEGSPSKPWSVVIRHEDDSDKIVIEGFGDDLSTPLMREEVVLNPQTMETE